MRLAPWLTAAVVATAASPAYAATLTVGQGGLSTIGAAVGAARPGDTVRVGAGRYAEHVKIAKAIVLEGVGRPVLDGSGQGDVLTVSAPGVTVRGFRVTGSGTGILDDTAAIKVLAPRSHVVDNVIDDSLYGIYVANASDNVIVGNAIAGLTRMRPTDRGDGIRLHNAQHNTITGNTIHDGRDGIYFNSSGHNAVRDNAISRVRYGLHYMYSDDNTFTHNRFTETEAGSALMFSRRITLSHNLFSGNRGYRAYGLLLKDCEDSTVTENVIAGNRTGIFIDGAVANTFTGNRIAGNDTGVEVRASSESNTFTANTLGGNTEAVAMPTGDAPNTWEGNYWSDYRGYDLDGDGTGDVGHQAGAVLAYISENLPPARLFLLSPALQALEFAERAAPVMDLPKVEDAHPAMRPFPVPDAPAPPASVPQGSPFWLVSLAFVAAGLIPLLLARKAFRP